MIWVNLIGSGHAGQAGGYLPGIKDGAFNGTDNLPAPFKPTWQERFREFESISASGYKPPWAAIAEAEPSPPQLHALITPPKLLHLTLSS